ncbi:MAG: helix-turn-helix transcriptional regulator [Roseburia sp.]|nr:helix-turn-helix transcriptional regulator [Roseburia sp.]
MNDSEFGTIKLYLKERMEEQNLSLSKLSFRAEMQRTQLKHYYNGDIQRLDMAVLSRLCYALDCDLHDLLEYIPPEQKD